MISRSLQIKLYAQSRLGYSVHIFVIAEFLA